jgi:hypothetical protein
MALTNEQRSKLESEAKRRGVDPVALIREAESLSEPGAKPGATSGGELPKLFMYHLPFVRVREVRQRWLGLTEAFPGDESIASEWAAEHGAETISPPPDAAE